jgi:hypothetical protein
MTDDSHETIRHIIDKTLVSGASSQEEQSLRDHLQICSQCQIYLSAGARAIGSLGGFSFDVDPGLQAKVHSSLRLRARQIKAEQFSRRRLVWSCVIALLLTAAGSFIDLQFGTLAAEFLHLPPAHVRPGLIDYWIIPSLWLLLLFPMLPALIAPRTNQKGISQ